MSRPTCLILTHRVPFPPNRGDRIRTYHFLQHIAQRADVWLGCLADEPVNDSTWRTLRSLCSRVAIVPVQPGRRWIRAATSFLAGKTISEGAFHFPRLQHIVSEWAKQTQFDAALCSSSALVPYLTIDALRHTPRFVDLIDVDSQKWLDYADASPFPKRPIFRIEGHRLRRLESSIADWASGITVVSEAEAALYRQFCPDGPIQAIPNGVDTDYFSPSTGPSRKSDSPMARTPERQPALKRGSNSHTASGHVGRDAAEGDNGCVFVGALDYKPNVDGIVSFARHVWPEIHRHRPKHLLRIVGRAPVPRVQQLQAIPGVEVIGTVPDVRPWFAQAAVCVVPLHIARGVQNKVLEALAMGKAVVAAPEPLVGVDIEDGTHILKATTPQEWLERVLQLLDDPALRQEIGIGGQAWVTAHHRWEQCLAPLMRFLQLDDRASPGEAIPVVRNATAPQTATGPSSVEDVSV